MHRLNHRTLVDHGRKAGLKTWELYPALAGQASADQQGAAGHADGNGFAAGFDAEGHPVYRPDEANRGE